MYKNTNESIKDRMISAVQSAQAFLYKPNTESKKSTIQRAAQNYRMQLTKHKNYDQIHQSQA